MFFWQNIDILLSSLGCSIRIERIFRESILNENRISGLSQIYPSHYIMAKENLFNISPIDGRYAEKISGLNSLCSEFGLLKRRIQIEIEWLKILSSEPTIAELKALDAKSLALLDKLIADFNLAEAKQIKIIEKEINHDVKSIEYYLRKKLRENADLKPCIDFIHFACTSEDINNIAYALLLKDVRAQYLLPAMGKIVEFLAELTKKFAALPMLSHTHSQPATPTTVGKEFANFAARLERQRNQLANAEILAKFNGTVGNFNAHVAAYPEVDWIMLSKKIVASFGLTWNPYTTQIEPHDYIAEWCAVLQRFNNILLMLVRDLWGYMALGYFKQKVTSKEVGSSVMPHKVNPVDFENAEGNLGVANALLNHFIEKLPISRFQRDLSDSTVLRNLGVAFAHSLIAYQSVIIGLSKLEVEYGKIAYDLHEHWEVLTEAVQTIMRRHGITNAYEQVKEFSHGKIITQELLQEFVAKLPLAEAIKKFISTITPMNYVGNAVTLASAFDQFLEKQKNNNAQG